MALTDQDLRYAVRVQDRQLRELQRNIRALNKEMDASERTAGAAGGATASGYGKADRSARQARGSTLAFGASLKDIAKLSIGIGSVYAAFDTGRRVLGDSVDAASNLEEQGNKVRRTVGEAADEMIAWSAGLAQSHGIAQDQALQYAGTIAGLLRVTGVLPEDAAKLSQRLVELSSDMTSFNNASIEETLQALQSGLVGMPRPLRRFQVLLDAARVAQEASRMTGKESAKELTQQDKLLARYNLILQDTSIQQGDFALTSDELENSQRRLSAAWRNAEGDLGKKLVPAMKALTNAGADLLIVTGKLAGLWGDADRWFDVQLPDWLSTDPLDEWLRRNVINPVREKIGLEPFGEEEGRDIFDGIDASLSSAGAKFIVMLHEAAAAMGGSLRTRLGGALEDVHDKALDVFDRETDALLNAQDRVTDDLLDAFDKTSDRMLERMKVLVHVGERQFETGRGQLTPAERELEALEKIDRKRNVSREIFDAREALVQAELIGDPKAIQEAKRRLQDAETERKKIKLSARAETERKAADEALDEEERQLRESRENLREDLDERRRLQRDALADRRSTLRENLDAELQAQEEALQKGKKKAAAVQREIIATLRKFGADYEGVGKELGGKFFEGFAAGLMPKGAKITLTPQFDFPKDRPRGGATGGIAGRLGPAGGTDTIPAWLTPGEMILTGADQRRLARQLGVRATGWPLLSAIRMGFAEGGVADEDLFRELLERFSQRLSADFVSRSRRRQGLGSQALLTGVGMTDAERRAQSPLHIQSQLKFGLTASQKAELGRGGMLELMGELAQRQAHVERSGLVIRGPMGVSPGPSFRDPFGGQGSIPGGAFSVGEINVHGAQSPWATAQMVRREMIRIARRNPRHRRGRNVGSRVLGDA